jgi:hypothetical protein
MTLQNKGKGDNLSTLSLSPLHIDIFFKKHNTFKIFSQTWTLLSHPVK